MESNCVETDVLMLISNSDIVPNNLVFSKVYGNVCKLHSFVLITQL